MDDVIGTREGWGCWLADHARCGWLAWADVQQIIVGKLGCGDVVEKAMRINEREWRMAYEAIMQRKGMETLEIKERGGVWSRTE